MAGKLGTYQKVRNSQSYTFLKSPAMVGGDTGVQRKRRIKGWKQNVAQMLGVGVQELASSD